MVAWSQDRYAYKKRKRINVVPQETPNRKFPPPQAFVYHPEVFPDLAEFNPEPREFEIPRAKPKKQRNPQTLNISVVSEEQRNVKTTGFLDMSKLVDVHDFKGHRGLALRRLDRQKIAEFREELGARVALLSEELKD